MITKLRVDLINGVLEVEGEENFVRQIYDEFKEGVVSRETKPSGKVRTTKRMKRRKETGTSAKKQPVKAALKILGQLDLTGGNRGPSLSEFFEKYKAKHHYEKIVLCVYYLDNIEGVDSITTNHVYTCYRKLKLPLPKHFAQAIIDTKNQKGLVEMNSQGEISLTTQGVNLVEHEMEQTVT